MAGHVEDRWHVIRNGRKVRSERYGKGKRWRARFPLADGTVRSKACDSQDAAEAYLARMTMSTADGTYIDPSLGRATFREYAESWRAQQIDHRPSTRAAVENRLRVTVYPRIGDRSLSSLRRSDIQHLITEASMSLAPSTVRVMHSYVAAVFKTAVADRVIASSPCSGVKLPAVVQTRVIPMTVEQVAAVRDALPARWRAAVTLASRSGLRPAEWAGLTIDRLAPRLHLAGKIIPQSCVIRVDRQLVGRDVEGAPVFGPPKTSSSDRSVTIGATATAALVEHLREYGPGPDGLIFTTGANRALTRKGMGEAWRDASAGLGLKARSGWHECRHFAASLLIARGMSPVAVAARLGHKDATETLQTYGHLWATDEQAMVDAIEDGLAGF